MDDHLSFLRTACRLCGNALSKKSAFADKSLFKNELLSQFQINIEEDLEDVHPNSICAGCKRSLYRIRGNTDVQAKVSTSKRPYLWTSHSEGNCPCNKKARGRPPKSVEEKKVVTKDNESDTESGEDIETVLFSMSNSVILLKSIFLKENRLLLAHWMWTCYCLF